MKFLRPTLLLAAVLFIGAGCAPAAMPANTNTNTAPSAGLYFDAPPRWGLVGAEAPVSSPLDTGKRRVIRFSKEPLVRLNMFTNDFREGVTEGVPEYFSLEGSPDRADAAAVRAALRPPFAILSFEPFHAGYKMVHTSSFAREQLLVSYLLPQVEGGPMSAMVTVNIATRNAAWTKAAADKELSSEANRALLAETDTFAQTVRISR